MRGRITGIDTQVSHLLAERQSLVADYERHRFAIVDRLRPTVVPVGAAPVAAGPVAAATHQHPRQEWSGARVRALLLWLGAKTASMDGQDRSTATVGAASWPAAYAGAVALTLTNPPTIITFAAIFTALAPPSGFDASIAAATVGGVFAGSLLWWCGIVGALSLFRHAMGPRTRRWIDRAAGLALAAFGLLELRRGV